MGSTSCEVLKSSSWTCGNFSLADFFEVLVPPSVALTVNLAAAQTEKKDLTLEDEKPHKIQ